MAVILFIIFILIIGAIIFGIYKLSRKYRVVAIVVTLSMSIVLFKHAYEVGVDFSHGVSAMLNGPNASIASIAFFVLLVIVLSIAVPCYRRGKSLAQSLGIGCAMIPVIALTYAGIIRVSLWIFPGPWLRWIAILSDFIILTGIVTVINKILSRF